MINKDTVELNIDKIINQLVESKGKNKPTQLEVKAICCQARQILLSQPNILELDAPVKICGDIHGQYTDLLTLFQFAGFPPTSNYLFLGDYVDRGKQSVETITLLLAYKIKYPQNFFLLRGNHQSASINRIYGFYDQCKRKYNLKIWKAFSDCFNVMPICAIIGERIICMHGGLSPDFDKFDQLFNIRRPIEIPDKGLLCDILWSDPQKNIEGYEPNDRGLSYVFGQNVVKEFLKKHNLDLICRAHQVVEQGYEFFANRQLVTVFSAPNYCNQYQNKAAMMIVDESLVCSFHIIKPKKKEKKEENKPTTSSRQS